MKLFTILFAAGVLSGSPLYTVVDLGPAHDNFPQPVSTGSGNLFGGSWSAVYDVNSSGEEVGYTDVGKGGFRAFTWSQSSGVTILGTLGGYDSWGMAINDSGEVVGHSTTRSGYVHAFSSSGGPLVDLGTLGGKSSYAYDVNDAGAIVGYSTLRNGDDAAFVVLNGVMLDLNTLISGRSGWSLDEAFSINNSGQIFGVGEYDCHMELFRLDPKSTVLAAVPEPSTFVLLGIGLVILKLRSQRPLVKFSNACLRHRFDKHDVVG